MTSRNPVKNAVSESLPAAPAGGALSRRLLLGGAGVVAAAGVLGAARARAFPIQGSEVNFDNLPICRAASNATDLVNGAPKPLKISWNANAVCLVPVPVAVEYGFFKKYNLDVELVNYSGSTDQLLEAIATGKSDAGIGMALRWLKPLEQGFDVKIVAGTHGGCMRVLAPTASGINGLADLKGKTLAVSDLASPGKNFFAIQLTRLGIDPNKDVEWRQYPGNLLRLAVEKGEVQALVDGDPNTYLWLKDGTFREVASNLDGEYRDRTCCILGVRGSLIRSEPQVAKALTLALLDAVAFTVHNPEKAAQTYLPYAPGATADDLKAMVNYHTHHHHPVGDALKRELKAYADDLKVVQVFKPSTDTAKFADKIYADVLSV